MKLRFTFKAACILFSTAAVSFALTSCRTIPSDPERMSCDDLDYMASESVAKNKYPFFVSQLSHPADWRMYSFTDGQVDWIKNDSRRRVRIGKRDWAEVEALRLNTATRAQEYMKVRAPFDQCPQQPVAKSIQLTFTPIQSEEKKVKSTQASANLEGTTSNDQLARLVCGLEDYPEKNKYEVMAQKWKQCQTASTKNATATRTRK